MIGGFGYAEIIIVAVISLLCIGVPVVAFVLILLLGRKSESARNANGVAELRAEVARLREEIERLKKGSP